MQSDSVSSRMLWSNGVRRQRSIRRQQSSVTDNFREQEPFESLINIHMPQIYEEVNVAPTSYTQILALLSFLGLVFPTDRFNKKEMLIDE